LLGLPLKDICTHLAGFTGIKRRLEVIGTKNDITVIDDFAHNPDKIAATLSSLKEFPGRLRIVFQVHGYNPIRLMRQEFAEVFSKYLSKDDRLYIPEVLYLGGTVDRSVTAKDLVSDLVEKGVHAVWLENRNEALTLLAQEARPGDRIIVMGARDDTLSDFAREILN
jgi:UDP-N-acetylmuramate--alanine ligase